MGLRFPLARWHIPPARRLRQSLLAGAVVALLVLIVWLNDLFVQTRLRMSNAFFVPRHTSGEIVIVAVDDASLGAYGRSVVTWPRSLHAQLVDRLSEAGARVIAFDLLFSEATDEDDALADAIRRARISGVRTRTVMPVVGAQMQQEQSGDLLLFRHFLTPIQTIGDTVAALGHTNAEPDPDGAIRWQPTRVTDGRTTSLSFGVVTYLTYLRIPAIAYEEVIDYSETALRLPPDLNIPLDDQGRMLINYRDAPGDGFPVVSFHDVIEGSVDPAVFADKIVLVGLTNHTGLNDMYYVPIGLQNTLMPGVEIHANVIETLLLNVPLSGQSRFSQAMVILIVAVGASLIYGMLAWRWYWIAAAVAVLLVAWFLSALLYFNLRHRVLDLFYPSVAIILDAPLILVLSAQQESRRLQQVELLLNSLIDASSRRLEMMRILDGISADLARILKAPGAEIWLWESRARRLNCAYASPLTSDTLPVLTHRALGMQALELRQRIHADGFVAVPMLWQNLPLGALVAPAPRRLDHATAGLLELFALQSAAVIASAIQYDEVQTLSNLKTRMIRMASHDLRNPLTVFMITLELLRDNYEADGALPRRHLTWIERMENSSKTMLQIIDEILSLERARRGLEEIEAISLSDLLRQVADSFEHLLRTRQHTLTTELPDGFPNVTGDASQLREALGNLISNAIKYTPPGGQISVRLAQVDEMARVAVQDNGLGIPDSAREQLFQEFFRVRTTQTAEIEGTGLGLSLVKAVVEGHGGRVWFTSEDQQGSTFFVELPLALPPEKVRAGQKG